MMNCLTKELFALRDENYKEFHARLIPDIPKERIIGVRTPALRALAKRVVGTKDAKDFLNILPHFYYDENNLHGALIDYGHYDFDETVRLLELFLPYIDNWATCDLFVPHLFKKYPRRVSPLIEQWLASGHPFTIRFGLNCLMRDFMSEHFDNRHLKMVSAITHDDYYVRMGVAWYYSVAFVKQWESAVPYFEQNVCDDWIRKKSVQKARESFRLDAMQKEKLSKLIRKD